MKKQWAFKIFLFGFILLLAACGDTAEQLDKNDEQEGNVAEQEAPTKEADEIEDSTGSVPLNLKIAENAAFPVGTKVKIFANHMEGMKGAEGVVVAVYDTTAYEISYRPTTGGEKVENYKWVIHEELDGASGAPMEPGRELVINADHIEGMDGATATIESADEGPVYVVDFTTTTGEEVKNYKWLVESELAASDESSR
ncbi:YdhK family protein [Ureibacillus sp. FSL W7-1570]|uniref:YdhK family protein n=1 Tax=Ureibacillus sp. FSL W7-1570 TaxID=2954593 RepID=UPI00315A0878